MAARTATLPESKSQIEILITTLQILPSSKISQSSKQTLIRLLSADLRYLSSLSSPPPSLNSGYFSSIINTILHPSVRSVTRVCKPVSAIHVDIVCNFNLTPSWFFVSDRNPNYIVWPTVKSRVKKVLSVAESVVVTKPESVVFLYSKGLNDEVSTMVKNEFGAVEIDVFKFGRAFEVKVAGGGRSKVDNLRSLGCELGNVDLDSDEFGRFVGSMRRDGDGEVVNFDTTAMVAMVSWISNGGCGRILNGNEMELRAKFKCNYEFVIAQVMSELEHPILKELRDVIAGRKGIICESVCTEFKELVLMCGGPNEKSRADLLIKHLSVVRDSPSERVAALPTTRKIALKNKVVFGTGDYWHAPTVTANMGFVRAIAQTGMSLFTIEHRPRALIGD